MPENGPSTEDPPRLPAVFEPMTPVLSHSRPSAFGAQWEGPGRAAVQAVPVASVVAAVVAAGTLTWDRPGVGWLITALAVAVAIGSVLAGRMRPEPRGGVVVRLGWALAAVVLLGMGAVRAAPWLFVLCVLTALLCGSLALAGGRSVRGLFLGAVVMPIATVRALPWAGRGLAAVRGRTGGSAARTTAAVAISAALLVLFGALLAGADAAFSTVLSTLLPTVDGVVVVRWALTFAAVAVGMFGACFLALAPPAFDSDSVSPRPATSPDSESGAVRRLRRIEWALPVGTLAALFGGFVGVQATVLFGGGDHVLRTAELTYAQYARTGFWQLSVVTLLTLVVIAIAARLASRETVADRAWLRALLGGLTVLTLVIVASAVSRMWAYEQAYGFTQLRLLVSVCELWLGIVFVLVLAAGVRLRAPATWLPRTVLATAVAALIGICALNPDGFIAERNVIRYTKTNQVDLGYLGQLSADAVAALDRLPEPLRTCALERIHSDLLRTGPDEWRQWNLGRYRARDLLANYRVPDASAWRACTAVTRAGGS